MARLSCITLLPQISIAFHFHRPTTNIPCASIKSSNTDEQESRWRQKPFDFSSKQGWEDFYKRGRLTLDDADDDVTSLEYEWHPHIPHSAIIEAISPSIVAAIKSASQSGKMPSILVIGCGNSSLPRILHDAFDHPVRITCLDYSQVCIDMIRGLHSDSYPNMDFVAGDAMKLKEVINMHNSCNSGEDYHYDIVIDKGLMDALMCGEGFDCETFLRGIDQVLTSNSWGMHALVCFPLMRGTKDSLVKLGQQHDGTNLFWRFDLPVEGGENGRASFNVGKRSLWDVLELETSETNWF